IAFAKSLRRFETVSATRAQLAPLLRPELLVELDESLVEAPVETRRRALLLLPTLRRPSDEPGRAGTTSSPGTAPSPARFGAVSKLAATAAITLAGGAIALFLALPRGHDDAPRAAAVGVARTEAAFPTGKLAPRGRHLETLAAMLPPV